MEINGSSAIITGGASGLGEATARKLATEGVRVTVFDRNEDRAKEVVAEIGGSANYVAGDVTDPDDCQRAVDQAADGGNLRIAVNCAGTGWVGRVINRDGSPHDLAPFKFIQDLNVIGTFNVMTKAASAISTAPWWCGIIMAAKSRSAPPLAGCIMSRSMRAMAAAIMEAKVSATWLLAIPAPAVRPRSKAQEGRARHRSVGIIWSSFRNARSPDGRPRLFLRRRATGRP